LAGETEVLGENLPQSHFCPSQNPTWPDPGLNPGRRGGKPATNRLSYGAAFQLHEYYTIYLSNIYTLSGIGVSRALDSYGFIEPEDTYMSVRSQTSSIGFCC
jgi:hypothetical protein